MEFIKGKLYQVVEDAHLEGCILEFVKEKNGLLVFNVIKGNDNYFDFHGNFELKKNYFRDGEIIPLVQTEDDVHEVELFGNTEYVNHPAHYNQGIEVIDFIESHNMDFNTGNVIKYVSRAKHKGKYLEDLKKARWYLDRLISKGEKHD